MSLFVTDEIRSRRQHGLLGFLLTERTPDELRAALAVITEFKALRSFDEPGSHFTVWHRLDQLEEYLRLLTGDGADKVRDKTARAFLAEHRKPPIMDR